MNKIIFIIVSVGVVLSVFVYKGFLTQPSDIPLASLPDDAYSFVAIGHAYGRPNKEGPLPASTLLNSLDLVASSTPDFIVFLGDSTQGPVRDQYKLFIESVVEPLGVSSYFIPGNHDIINPELFQEYFGMRSFTFRKGSAMFIGYDAELDEDLSKEQVSRIIDLLGAVRDDSDITSLFIFMHELHWAVGNPPYEKILKQSNCAPCLGLSDAFTREILPVLQQLAPRPVYLIAGDVGARWAVPFFYHRGNDNLHYVATGLGDDDRDTALRVIVTHDGGVSLSVLPLGASAKTDLEAYGFNQLPWNYMKYRLETWIERHLSFW